MELLVTWVLLRLEIQGSWADFKSCGRIEYLSTDSSVLKY